MKPCRTAFTALVLSFFAAWASAASDQPPRPASRAWIERPWEFRYFIAVNEPHSFAISAEQGSKVLGNPKAYQSFEAIFSLTTTIRAQPEDPPSEGAISALVIEFDDKGRVTSSHSGPSGLMGHLNRLNNITLAAGDNLDSPKFDLLNFP